MTWNTEINDHIRFAFKTVTKQALNILIGLWCDWTENDRHALYVESFSAH